MAEETSINTSHIGWGLFAAGMGAFIIAGTSGLLGIDMHPTEGTPQWIGILAGAIFLAGGFAVVLQSLPAAKPRPDGSLSPDAPRWVRGVSLLLGLTIAGGLTAIAYWVGFGPGERHFSGGLFFLSAHANDMLGRVVFAFGAVLASFMFLAFLIVGVRQLVGRNKT